MQKTQKGFTLIELVVVIVLLGILGVTALGKFQDLSTDAQTAANSGIASELTAGSSINYAARLLNNTAGVALTTATEACTALVDGGAKSLLTTTLATTEFTVTGTGDCTATGLGAGGTFECSVVGAGTPAGTAATATIICTP